MLATSPLLKVVCYNTYNAILLASSPSSLSGGVLQYLQCYLAGQLPSLGGGVFQYCKLGHFCIVKCLCLAPGNQQPYS